MPKLLWVLLPLLPALAWLAWRWLAWRRHGRRLPGRPLLNGVFSLLLLGYVGTTAALGIFWVANQQLPVFDWHYLFGYATVALVLLHLGFNARTLWRTLRGRPPAAELPPRTVPGGPRRVLLALAGAVAAGAAGFWLGLRHGRSTLQVDGARGDAAGPAAGAALAFVERYHAFSSHSRRGVLLRAPGTDWGDAPPPFLSPPEGARRVALPAPDRVPAGAGAGFGARADAATPARVALATLACLLWHAAGITERRGGLALRAAPSSGALFPAELHVIGPGIAGLPAGAWHHHAAQHALLQAPGAAVGAAAALLADVAPGADALVVVGAVFRRSGHKYRDRCYRYVLADLGHLLENLRVAAAALNWPVRMLPQIDEPRVAAVLGLDEAEQGVIAVLALGAGAAAPVPVPAAPAAPAELPPFDAALGVTGAMHRASARVLPAGAAPPLHAPAAAPPAHEPAAAPLGAGGIVLPESRPLTLIAGNQVLHWIAARRSRRRFAATALPLADLAALLAALRLHEPPLLSGAVRAQLVVHAVEGLAPGAWRWGPGARRLQPRRAGDLRDAARAAALDQDVIGEAAAALVLSLDRAALAAAPAGPARGYRQALLEAGAIGERWYLEATARGLAACAVGAFYDDEAAALVGINPAQEWVLHFAAVGPRAG